MKEGDDVLEPWDLQPAVDALSARARRIVDTRHGPGVQLRIASTTTLELYPETMIARLSTRVLRIVLHNAVKPTVTERGVSVPAFDLGHAIELTLHADGTFVLQMIRVPERPSTPSR